MRQHGLYISQRNRRGVAWLETEIPYEELLPVGLEYAAPTPLRLPPVGTWVVLWLLVQVVHQALKNQAGISSEFWVAGLGFLVGLGAVYVVRRHLSHSVTLGTNRIRITLRDQHSQRAALEAFTNELRQRAHSYLRDEYAQINPLGPIELQLHRLNWLHQLKVLSSAERQVLRTRLTGRLSLDPLTLMGQELETPYVN
ncbi:hypothetical protein [Hymenobacter glacieicola]|nr:hypothetical protein [Hymenobacter glacieicola]